MKKYFFLEKTINEWFECMSKKSVICLVCCCFSITSAISQEGVYDIISTTGTIVDKISGQELQVGDRISFQTELEFGSLHDRAVLLSDDKAKFFWSCPVQRISILNWLSLPIRHWRRWEYVIRQWQALEAVLYLSLRVCRPKRWENISL